MIGIPFGLLTANAAEWVVHKHLLHEGGREPGSFWQFHWHTHHRNCRRNGNHDADYTGSVLHWNGQGKEAAALVAASALVAPLYAVAPWYTAALHYSAVNYYRKHKRSHLDPAWGRAHLRWHYDHHMGPNQDANWCVTRPWFDIVMGTHKPYAGTWGEKQRVRRKRRKRWEAAQRTREAVPAPTEKQPA
jgi:sterol desaturase/sphingolipid hydroxylase (fatty acid hydroxylase superfamily)